MQNFTKCFIFNFKIFNCDLYEFFFHKILLVQVKLNLNILSEVLSLNIIKNSHSRVHLKNC